MGKPFALIVVGLFVIIWGCRTQSGTATEVEHLIGGRTQTFTCQGGEPVEEVDPSFEPYIVEKCEDERSSQRTSARVLLMLGVLTAGYGALELRKARSG